jgi:hypothetical protein
MSGSALYDIMFDQHLPLQNVATLGSYIFPALYCLSKADGFSVFVHQLIVQLFVHFELSEHY